MLTPNIKKLLDEFNVQTSNDYFFERDIVYLHQVQNDLNRVFENGEERGTKTGIDELDPHFLWMKSYVDVFGGIPNHGKSTFLQFLCLLKSKKDGTKWAFFAPESKLAYRWYMNLIHSYAEKPVDKESKGQMTKEEFELAKEFVSTHFYFCKPKTGNTLDALFEVFRNLNLYHDVSGFVIDPYNSLTDWTQARRDDIQLNVFFDRCNDFLSKIKAYFCVVMHPAGHIRGQKNESGNYSMPTQYDFAGGAMVYNKSDRVTIIHRPYSNSDPKNNSVLISVQKAKEQRLAGFMGEIQLSYNFSKNSYEPINLNYNIEKKSNEDPPF